MSTEQIQIGSDIGFQATAEAIHSQSGTVLSRAQALCTTDEDSWRSRGGKPVTHPERFAMAQTRARSRAFRSVFDFVAQIAGYEGTTGEDMAGREAKPPIQQPQRKQQPAGGVITAGQVKRLFAISRKAGWSDEELHALLRDFGYESSKDVERVNYDAIVNRVEAGDKVAASPLSPMRTMPSSPASDIGQWRSQFSSAAEHADIEDWLKGAHQTEGDAAIDQFFSTRWDAEPDDALEAAALWIAGQRK